MHARSMIAFCIFATLSLAALNLLSTCLAYLPLKRSPLRGCAAGLHMADFLALPAIHHSWIVKGVAAIFFNSILLPKAGKRSLMNAF